MVSAARAYLLEGVAKRIAPWLIASAKEWDGYRATGKELNQPLSQTRKQDGKMALAAQQVGQSGIEVTSGKRGLWWLKKLAPIVDH